MSREETITIQVPSVAAQLQLAGVAARLKHPLFSILRFEDLPPAAVTQRVRLISDLYQITLKKDCPCKLQYGQTPYDFGEGVMSFFAPKQVVILEPGAVLPAAGWLLLVHPDFLRGHPLSQTINDYGFFEYAVNEALLLSAEEQDAIEGLLRQVEQEANRPLDHLSQAVLILHLELLLTYCQRYVNRQFITRKPNNHELLRKVELLLHQHFTQQDLLEGLPTVGLLAEQLHLSPKYLSDCLKQLTGQTAQQLIHEKLLAHAKHVLTTTELAVSEIAYQLGFEYPQSFSKLFKNKTNQTPLEYRQSFN
ncbi:helix-turn-helix domain-containing protein [Hymenobacter sp. PAMC 26628]|uniref:helix-turn-helix domain-containing protein n=1 Tax=Hymenobacter sp. PAMC 26628 TaxID=1484118 RepID=UPI0007704BE4|nr:AraC family transcriptional regulator [Hymenobacter sp. PAMC 26628]AMJ67811.1 AraC family transcriptional regulator [Hymenobacter sp. PAMC 26628]